MLRFSTVLIFALILFSCNSTTKNHWIQINNEHFRLHILSGYSNSNETIDQCALGKLSHNYYYWRNPKLLIEDLGFKLLEFYYYEIPKQFNSKTSDSILDTCTHYFLENEYSINSKGRTLEEKDITLNGFSGKALKVILDVGKEDSLIVFQRLFVAHSRVYVLSANGYKKNIDNEKIEHFMSSFSLKN